MVSWLHTTAVRNTEEGKQMFETHKLHTLAAQAKVVYVYNSPNNNKTSTYKVALSGTHEVDQIN